uniref:Uncharacterized protein n=1 Tax=Solanum tuberosum TaxID=4113 RepID=M1AKN1_SOLTU
MGKTKTFFRGCCRTKKSSKGATDHDCIATLKSTSDLHYLYKSCSNPILPLT